MLLASGNSNEEILCVKSKIDEVYARSYEYYDKSKLKIQNITTIYSSANNTYLHLSKIDSEIHKTIEIMSNLVANLNGRKVELKCHCERLQQPQVLRQNLEEIITILRNEKLDKDLLKAAAQNVVEKNLKDSQEEEILNFETLFDFINYKSVVSLQEKAELSYNNLQESRKRTNYNLTSLIETIRKPIAEVNEINSHLSFYYTEINNKYGQLQNSFQNIEEQIKEIKIQYERVRTLYSYQVLNKNLTISDQNAEMVFKKEEEYSLLGENQLNMNKIIEFFEEIEVASEDIREQSINYEECFHKKRDAYKELVKLSPIVKERLESIEKNIKEFDCEYKEVEDAFSDLSNLISWYKLFSTSYQALMPEIMRRILEYKELCAETELMRKYLKKKFASECLIRRSFCDRHKKFLPSSLHWLITEIPIQYEIYPYDYKYSLLSKFSSLEGTELSTKLKRTGKLAQRKSKTRADSSGKKGEKAEEDLGIEDERVVEIDKKERTILEIEKYEKDVGDVEEVEDVEEVKREEVRDWSEKDEESEPEEEMGELILKMREFCAHDEGVEKSKLLPHEEKPLLFSSNEEEKNTNSSSRTNSLSDSIVLKNNYFDQK